MKKVLLINGSPHEFGCTYYSLKEISDTLNKEGIETEFVWVDNKPISGCLGCNKCNEGKCAINDKVNEILAKINEIGAIIIGSPVHYAAPTGKLVSFLDRLFYSSKGRLKNKLGAAIVTCRRAGSSSALDQLNKYFLISSMPIVSSIYWNQVHGNTINEIKEDLEGLQTMRILAQNMAWLLKCIECGTLNNIPLPNIENKIKTNFIR